jgi:hypothetical protein
MCLSTCDVDGEPALTEQRSHLLECGEHEEVFVAVVKLANLESFFVIK